MAETLKIGVIGCLGRMGTTIMKSVIATGGAEIFAGSEVKGHPGIGSIIAGTEVVITDDAQHVFDYSDVVIDFTPPGNTAAHAAYSAETGTALVIGTTGLSDADHAALDRAATQAAIVQAGNFSLGVNLLVALTKQVAARLGTDWDIEILEMHHKHKVDAPSGTAIMLGEAAALGRGARLEELRAAVRDGISPVRKTGSIGFASVRGGSVIGEHDVIFACGSERLTLSHRAENRSLFADGAVKAALWVARKKAGRYDMQDVLGIGQGENG